MQASLIIGRRDVEIMRRVDEIGDSLSSENMHEEFLKVIDQSLLGFEGLMLIPVVGKLVEVDKLRMLTKL